MLIFFSYSAPSGILGSDGKQITAKAAAMGRDIFYFFPFILMNRLNDRVCYFSEGFAF